MRTAPILEELGFYRLWLAEHHEKHFCYAAPEVLLASLASATSTLRIGVAGMLMHFHTPLRVAEVFRSLTALHGQRIDLGLASGLAGDPEVQLALRPGFDLKDALASRLYTRQIETLVSHLAGQVSYTNPLYSGAVPLDAPTPNMVLLGGGAGRGNMILAARYGLDFCYSLAHGNSDTGVQTVSAYREQFQGKTPQGSPYSMIAASILCANTSLQAFAMLGQLLEYSPGLRSNIVGDPYHCRNRIVGLLHKYQCDEIVLMPMYARSHDKIAAYRALASALDLSPSSNSVAGLEASRMEKQSSPSVRDHAI